VKTYVKGTVRCFDESTNTGRVTTDKGSDVLITVHGSVHAQRGKNRSLYLKPVPSESDRVRMRIKRTERDLLAIWWELM
jgi:hypothetical protein